MLLMGTRALRLKGHTILAKGIESQKIRNIQEIAKKSGRSYASIHSWIKRPEKVGILDLNMFVDVIVQALEIPPEELLSMPMSEFFELVDLAEAE